MDFKWLALLSFVLGFSLKEGRIKLLCDLYHSPFFVTANGQCKKCLAVRNKYFCMIWMSSYAQYFLNPLSPKTDFYVDLLICATSWGSNHTFMLLSKIFIIYYSRNLLFMKIYHLVLLKGC